MLINFRANVQKRIYSLFTILFCVGILAANNFAGMFETPGFIDDTFRPVLNGAAGNASRTVVQPDGKILVVGFFHLINGTNKNNLTRFNADGTLDTSFDTKSGVDGSLSAMALQPDGKIIIGGFFSNFSGQPVGNIARLNSDGSFDITFNSSGLFSTSGANNTVNDISVLSDGRILIGGDFTSYNGTAINRLARLNANGTRDTSFNIGTGPANSVFAIKQYSGGKILIGGFFTTYNGMASARIARINFDGSLDTTFNIGTGAVGGQVRTFAVQPDDKIVVGGAFTTFNAVAKNGITRLNSDGTNDSTFSSTGSGATVGAIALQSDGKLIVGGSFFQIGGGTRQSIARLNADGTFDATFDPGTGLNPTGEINDLALQTDNKVVLVGNFTSYNGTNRGSIARANTNGSLETGLNATASITGSVSAIARQSDGKVLIGGTFNAVNGTARVNIVRLNAGGTLDASFNPGTGANSAVNSIAIQSDGKIIIGGGFLTYNGVSVNHIARLNADGSLDTSFNGGTAFGLGAVGINTIAFQTSGKILVGGTFLTYNGVAVSRILRLNGDGSLDTSFSVGTGASSTVRKIVVQPDQKIVVGGDFQTFNGVTKNRIMRLNADGTDDSSFITGTSFNNSVIDLVLQANGKIIPVGSFTTFNGTTRNRAARLNADGSLDTTFDSGVGFNSTVNTIAPTEDGKFIVGGNFATVAGLPRNRLARLKANGNFDPKFLSGLGPISSNSPQIQTIVPHNGKFLIGGLFEIFNTSPTAGLVRLSNATKTQVDYDGDGKTDYAIARQYGGIGRQTYWIYFSNKTDYISFDFGVFGPDILQPGDYDGDGKTDIAVWRATPAGGESNAYFITLSSTNTTKVVQFGSPGDFALSDDYDGDGKDDMCVWRYPSINEGPGPATWIYRGTFNNPNQNLTYIPWGMRYGTQEDQRDKPFTGDYDGDGKADFRLSRRADINNPNSNQPAIIYTLTGKGAISNDYFGLAGDRTISGDFDGDGLTDLTVARGFNFAPGTTTWYIRYTSGIPDLQIQWGAGALDQFAQADYDGDGKTDIAVYRRGNENNFYILRSSDNSLMVTQWGTADPDGGPGSDKAVISYNNH